MNDDNAPMSCVGSGVLVDSLSAHPDKATCPACGRLVHIGGFPKRYLPHTPDERTMNWSLGYTLSCGFDETGGTAA